MNPTAAQVATAGTAAGTGLLATLALSMLFPALANPVALALGAAAALTLAFRHRLPYESPAFRLVLVGIGVAAGMVIWVSLQPGYTGI